MYKQSKKWIFLAIITLLIPNLSEGSETGMALPDQLRRIGGHLEVWDELTKGTMNGFKGDLEKPLEVIEHTVNNWRAFTEGPGDCFKEIESAKKDGAKDDTMAPWKPYGKDAEVQWKLSDIKKVCEAIKAATENVTKKYCYKFTTYVHERSPNEYIMLNTWASDCKVEGEDALCGADGADMNSPGLYQPVRIDCAKMPKANELGKAFKSLDPFFQKTTWQESMCYSKKGGITVAPAATFKDVKLAKGEFMGMKKFRGLEVQCFHKGIHTSKE